MDCTSLSCQSSRYLSPRDWCIVMRRRNGAGEQVHAGEWVRAGEQVRAGEWVQGCSAQAWQHESYVKNGTLDESNAAVCDAELASCESYVTSKKAWGYRSDELNDCEDQLYGGYGVDYSKKRKRMAD